jgi:hypothetical protein
VKDRSLARHARPFEPACACRDQRAHRFAVQASLAFNEDAAIARQLRPGPSWCAMAATACPFVACRRAGAARAASLAVPARDASTPWGTPRSMNDGRTARHVLPLEPLEHVA